MDIILWVFDFILHLDKHLANVVETFGLWTYLIIFIIIFMETGLVITPFLPGDSLMFMVGALSATDILDIRISLLILMIAATVGDTVNYEIGHFFGSKVFNRKDSFFLKKEHLILTKNFYEKHGGKTIIIARFLPIIRTCAPFVAGIAKMTYKRFLSFNIVGAVFWVCVYTLAGFFFGNIPFVQENFSVVLIGLLSLSVVPITIGILLSKKKTSSITQ